MMAWQTLEAGLARLPEHLRPMFDPEFRSSAAQAMRKVRVQVGLAHPRN
jgi:hypothetical protein